MEINLTVVRDRYCNMVSDLHEEMDTVCSKEDSISLALAIGIDKLCRYIIAKGHSYENTQNAANFVVRNLISINMQDIAEKEAQRKAADPVIYSSDSE